MAVCNRSQNGTAAIPIRAANLVVQRCQGFGEIAFIADHRASFGNPMLDAWWKILSARLDAGRAALHRLPEFIAYIAEALWMQALEESKRRSTLRDNARVTELDKQRLEVHAHVLSLREGELDSGLRARPSRLRGSARRASNRPQLERRPIAAKTTT